MSKITTLFKGILFENGELSLTRVIAFMGFILFSIGSLYLMITHSDWSGYSTFAGYTGGGGAALQFGNKFINSKFNSAPGSYNANGTGNETKEMK